MAGLGVAVISTGTMPCTVASAAGLVIATDGWSDTGRTGGEVAAGEVPAWLVAWTEKVYVWFGSRKSHV